MCGPEGKAVRIVEGHDPGKRESHRRAHKQPWRAGGHDPYIRIMIRLSLRPSVEVAYWAMSRRRQKGQSARSAGGESPV